MSLVRGDYIELLEKDDDFGDGWYLGRHIESNRNGLFPEGDVQLSFIRTMAYTHIVYTELASQVPQHIRTLVQGPSTESLPTQTENNGAAASSEATAEPFVTPPPMYTESLSSDTGTPQAHTPSPLNPAAMSHRTVSAPATGFSPSTIASSMPHQRSISLMMEKSRDHGEDSPVMNETLSVIDEHITDMNTPRSSLLAAELRGLNDSGSEYSSHIDHRLSYINGHETDEEERSSLTKQEVLQWDSRQVAEHLMEIGIERRHCDIFKEQEISGEVLLGVDQATIFMKEFDLGVVGRRLRTWHKIRAFQEEVEANERPASYKHEKKPSTSTTRKPSVKGSVLPKIPNFTNNSNTSLQMRQDSPRLRSHTDAKPGTPKMTIPDSPGRPSAASVREFNHSRRHSSIDYNSKSDVTSFGNMSKTSTPPTSPEASHKKQPSFDRNWRMNSLSATANRTSSTIESSILGGTSRSPASTLDQSTFEAGMLDHTSTGDLDRGYMSGGEVEGRKIRNVLRKNQPGSTSHSRQNSQKDDGKGSFSISKRHSRFSSAGSIREAFSSVKGSSPKLSSDTFSKFRSKSTGNTQDKSPAEEGSSGSPFVTNLEEYQESPTSVTSPRGTSDSPIAATESPVSRRSTYGTPKPTYRDKQDAFLGIQTASVSFPTAEQPTSSPARTGSTTSGPTPSIEGSVESPAKSEVTPQSTLSATGSKKVKTKKETSAYQKGLVRMSPREAMKQCDYSGWMKKKSPKMTSTWKPRLFVLRGRRLGYYYSEDDTEEKGVIDISSHRVLPADNDFLTGLHATLTGAKSSPTSPANAQTITMNAEEVAAQADQVGVSLNSSNSEGMFIFKLVPPRVGLSRAISFTKQMVHYFAVDNVKQGRLWMAALMKATIDRDESRPVSTTYNQKTISLSKAISMKQRPPALMGVEELAEAKGNDEVESNGDTSANVEDGGLNIQNAGPGNSPAAEDQTTPNANTTATTTTEPDAERPSSSSRGPESAPLLGVPLAEQHPALRPPNAALAPGKPDGEATSSHNPVAAGLRLVRSLSNGLRRSEDSRPSTDAPAENRPTSARGGPEAADEDGAGTKGAAEGSGKGDEEVVSEAGQRGTVGEALATLA